MRLDVRPNFSTPTPPMHRQRLQCIAGASPMHRQCIADASPMWRDPPIPSTPTTSRRPRADPSWGRLGPSWGHLGGPRAQGSSWADEDRKCVNPAMCPNSWTIIVSGPLRRCW
eukprot:3159395-Pyramimonas_sp.AAC.1